MRITVSHEEIVERFDPFVTERFDPSDPKWAGIVSEAADRRRRSARRRRLLGWLSRFRRTQRSVESEYSDYWAHHSAADVVKDLEKVVPCTWGQRAYMAQSMGTKRVQLLLLMRALQAFEPASVLEVGAGNGFNLLLASARFPGISFTGAELTASGVESARRLQRAPLPEALVGVSPEPLVDQEAHRGVTFRQANAVALPFKNGEFDVTFTILALEQMEEVRHRALGEIARVTSKAVILIEPFRDFNADRIRHDYIVSQDYFSARVEGLRDYGLEPVSVLSDIPCKFNLGVGMAVARKPGGGH